MISVGLLPASLVTCASLGVIGVVPLAEIEPKVAQLAGACGVVLVAVALLFVLFTKPCSEHECWEQPSRKFRVLFVSTVALLATCVGSYALGAALLLWAGPQTAWSAVGSAVVLILSVQEKAIV